MFNSISIFIVCFALRIFLMLYGEWQDKKTKVKFTDIDYFVFSDAAEFATLGYSPYQRATYRYSPIFSWIVTLNIYFHKVWGKFIFVIFDLCTAFVIEKILKKLELEKKVLLYSLSLWLFNPITMTVSCRGNADTILSFLVVSVIYALVLKKTVVAGVLFGIAVHLKVYPIIYSLSIFLFLGGNYNQSQGLASMADCVNFLLKFNMTLINKLFSKERLKFIFSSTGAFCALFSCMYFMYGYEFIENTYLYHVYRKDIKHNFSVYFYMLYLNHYHFLNLICFVNQAAILTIISCVMYEDLAFCFFLLTQNFVTFNKICTSQYFLWYISLLPLLVPGFAHLKLLQIVFPVFIWFSGQVLWLFFAYLLEFCGTNTFLFIWFIGICFFLINVFIALWCVHCYKFQYLFTHKGFLNVRTKLD